MKKIIPDSCIECGSEAKPPFSYFCSNCAGSFSPYYMAHRIGQYHESCFIDALDQAIQAKKLDSENFCTDNNSGIDL
ncbi:hypothetical protein AWQ24_09140 [Picosynechococcus sp. PCC 8807]|nr:hypothetical protein AWQ24_09140 [Picosynechococcus sp. PCC 8807]